MEEHSSESPQAQQHGRSGITAVVITAIIAVTCIILTAIVAFMGITMVFFLNPPW